MSSLAKKRKRIPPQKTQRQKWKQHKQKIPQQRGKYHLEKYLKQKRKLQCWGKNMALVLGKIGAFMITTPWERINVKREVRGDSYKYQRDFYKNILFNILLYRKNG